MKVYISLHHRVIHERRQYLTIIVLALYILFIFYMKRLLLKHLSDAERHELESLRKEENGLCIESTSDLQNRILDGLCTKGILTRTAKTDNNDINGVLPKASRSIPSHTAPQSPSYDTFASTSSEQTR